MVVGHELERAGAMTARAVTRRAASPDDEPPPGTPFLAQPAGAETSGPIIAGKRLRAPGARERAR